MNIHQIAHLSGLSRSQIDILISRHGIVPQGGNERGKHREFTKADAFDFAVIGEITRFGLANADAVLAVSSIIRRTLNDGSQEVFSHQTDFDPDESVFLLITRDQHIEPHFVGGEALTIALKRLNPALVLNATKIAREVEAAAKDQ